MSGYVDVAEADVRWKGLLHSLLIVLGSFLAATMLLALAGALLPALGITEDGVPVVYNATTIAVQYVGFFAFAGWYLVTFRAFDLFEIDRPSARQVGVVAVGTVILLAAQVGLLTLFGLFGFEPAQNYVLELGREYPRLFLLLIPIALFLNAPAEELLYRGLVQGLFRKAYGVVPGVLFASALFGLVHWLALGAGGSRVTTIAITIMLGVVLGTVYELTENLTVPIAIHALYNSIVYAYTYAEVTSLL